MIYLDIHGLECKKDLFCLCFDLLCKGLVLLFGNENRVELDAVSMEQFTAMAARLAHAGIKVNIETFDVSYNQELVALDASDILYESYKYLNTQPDNLDLTDYSLMFKIASVIYAVKFEVMRR